MRNSLRLCQKDENSFDTVTDNRKQCRKNHSTCSIQQCQFNVVAGVDAVLIRRQAYDSLFSCLDAVSPRNIPFYKQVIIFCRNFF